MRYALRRSWPLLLPCRQPPHRPQRCIGRPAGPTRGRGPKVPQPGQQDKIFPLGSSWVAVSLNGKAFGGERPTFSLDDQLRARGFGGCNNYSATAYPLREQGMAVGPVRADQEILRQGRDGRPSRPSSWRCAPPPSGTSTARPSSSRPRTANCGSNARSDRPAPRSSDKAKRITASPFSLSRRLFGRCRARASRPGRTTRPRPSACRCCDRGKPRGSSGGRSTRWWSRGRVFFSIR